MAKIQTPSILRNTMTDLHGSKNVMPEEDLFFAEALFIILCGLSLFCDWAGLSRIPFPLKQTGSTTLTRTSSNFL